MIWIIAKNEWLKAGIIDFKDLHDTFRRVLDKHVPFEKKYGMTNEQTFKHKEPNQAITAKSKCTNRYLKSKSEIAKQSK